MKINIWTGLSDHKNCIYAITSPRLSIDFPSS